MNEQQQTVLIGAGIIALAVLAGSVIIADKLSRSLDEKNFWEGSNIPAVAQDVHTVTGGISQIVGSIGGWTRA